MGKLNPILKVIQLVAETPVKDLESLKSDILGLCFDELEREYVLQYV
jgi:hypothetical protein